MAAKLGEENVATLFGDIHYFYGPETDNPPHHRFNKGSYVYLFENAHEGRTRIEVANHPGTALQDAFDGYLNHTSVRYTYRHSCMVSLSVQDVPNQQEWHLPTYDPQNQNIYHYKLHSLDIYFWTPRDAIQFVSGVRRLLPASQLDIEDEPLPLPPPPPQQQLQQQQQQQTYAPPPQQDAAVSSVVQNLERVVLTDGSAAVPSADVTAATAAPLFAPPPVSAVSPDPSIHSIHYTNTSAPAATATQQQLPPPPPVQQQPVTSAATPTTYAPIAYNPAAPAAPETIRHREKTPPPEDAAAHDPLHHRLIQDASTPFSPGLVVPTGVGPLSPGVPPPIFHSPPGAPAFPGPPPPPPMPTTASYGGGVGGGVGTAHPGHPGLVRAATMPASPFGPTGFPGSPGYGAGTPGMPMTPGFPSPGLPGSPNYVTSATSTPTPPPPPPPVGGYNQYSYGTAANNTHGSTPGGGSGDYSVHQQLYRPAEGETAYTYKGKQEPRGRLEEGAGRLERGVTGMLKKFEKKFG